MQRDGLGNHSLFQSLYFFLLYDVTWFCHHQLPQKFSFPRIYVYIHQSSTQVKKSLNNRLPLYTLGRKQHQGCFLKQDSCAILPARHCSCDGGPDGKNRNWGNGPSMCRTGLCRVQCTLPVSLPWRNILLAVLCIPFENGLAWTPAQLQGCCGT